MDELTPAEQSLLPTNNPGPDILTLADLMGDQTILLAKEQADKAILDAIGTQSASGLRPKLVEWMLKGCPSAFPLIGVTISPPTRCSDGETRGLADYIQFCSGKTIEDQVALLQAKLPDIRLSIANFQGVVTVVVLTG